MKNFKRKALIFGLLVGAMSIVACGGSNGGGGQSGDGGDASGSGKKKGPWTVTFDTNGGAETYDNQIVEHKGRVTNPGTPTRVDPVKGTYTFLDWRGDGQLWSFANSEVTQNITLVANWLERYAVDIKDADGNALGETTYVNCGDAINKPNEPAAPAGKTFYGWANIKNGGQIWDFDNAFLNKVMDDVELKPIYVDSSYTKYTFEVEECPDYNYEKWGSSGMNGATWSGGQWGTALIDKDFYDPTTGKNKYGASGDYEYGTSRVAGFAHFLYVEGNTLTWELESDAAATNVTLFMRLSAEYGRNYNPLTTEVSSWVDGDTFPITVNGTKIPYTKVNLRNIDLLESGYDYIPFQDYFVSASISLQQGTNVIQMTVDNEISVNGGGTIHASAPVVDCIKLYSPSTLTWPNAVPGNILEQ